LIRLQAAASSEDEASHEATNSQATSSADWLIGAGAHNLSDVKTRAFMKRRQKEEDDNC
jgi:hypothetical protein